MAVLNESAAIDAAAGWRKAAEAWEAVARDQRTARQEAANIAADVDRAEIERLRVAEQEARESLALAEQRIAEIAKACNLESTRLDRARPVLDAARALARSPNSSSWAHVLCSAIRKHDEPPQQQAAQPPEHPERFVCAECDWSGVAPGHDNARGTVCPRCSYVVIKADEPPAPKLAPPASLDGPRGCPMPGVCSAIAACAWRPARVETQETIAEFARQAFGDPSSNIRIAARANEEMAELLRALSADDKSPKAAEEAADVVIPLFRLSHRLGADLLAEVDKKMKINRGRVWKLDGTGHGYHVRADKLQAAAQEAGS